MNKVIIFGSTGTVGKHLVTQALEQGHQVTAFTRDKSKINIKHPNLTIVEGDVLNSNHVKNAIKGHDTVLCTLGAGRKGVIRSAGTQNIIKGMQATGVKKLICQSTLGAGDSVNNLNFFWKRVMFGWFLKEAYKDHQLQEEYVRKSNLDWTIIRPAAFTDGPKTGKYKHGFSVNDKTISLKISRADVADFMLNQLNNTNYQFSTPGLSY